MSANLKNEAYDLSLFEPQEKKSEPSQEKTEKKKENENNVIKIQSDKITKAQRRKRNPLIILGSGLLTIIVATVAITIVQSNVVLNELNEQILTAKTTIEKQDNLAAQYKLKVDSKLSTNVVQNYAENKLGMTQAKNAQKRFISLSDGDFGEVVRNDDTNNAVQTIANAFTSLWS